MGTREKVVSEIYSDTGASISEETLSELNNIDASAVYVVARDVMVSNKLSDDDHFDKVFETDGAVVYHMSHQ